MANNLWWVWWHIPNHHKSIAGSIIRSIGDWISRNCDLTLQFTAVGGLTNHNLEGLGTTNGESKWRSGDFRQNQTASEWYPKKYLMNVYSPSHMVIIGDPSPFDFTIGSPSGKCSSQIRQRSNVVSGTRKNPIVYHPFPIDVAVYKLVVGVLFFEQNQRRSKYCISSPWNSEADKVNFGITYAHRLCDIPTSCDSLLAPAAFTCQLKGFQLLAQLSHAHVGRELQTAVANGLLRGVPLPCFVVVRKMQVKKKRTFKVALKDGACEGSTRLRWVSASMDIGYWNDLTKKEYCTICIRKNCTTPSCCMSHTASTRCGEPCPWLSSALKRSCRNHNALVELPFWCRQSNHKPSPKFTTKLP